MKKLFLVLGALFLLGGCDQYIEETYTIQRQFSVEVLQEISPHGLVYQEPQGKNWWKGTYEDRPVLIKANVNSGFVNVNFIFLD